MQFYAKTIYGENDARKKSRRLEIWMTIIRRRSDCLFPFWGRIDCANLWAYGHWASSKRRRIWNIMQKELVACSLTTTKKERKKKRKTTINAIKKCYSLNIMNGWYKGRRLSVLKQPIFCESFHRTGWQLVVHRRWRDISLPLFICDWHRIETDCYLFQQDIFCCSSQFLLLFLFLATLLCLYQASPSWWLM